MKKEHPSFLQLDRCHLDNSPDPETSKHVMKCEYCSQYLSKLQETNPVPSWVVSLSPTKRNWFHWLGGSLLGGVVATAAVLFFVKSINISRESPYDSQYTTIKGGTPTLGLYIKHGESVSLWNGRSPIAPGDKLQLEVIPQEYGHIAVYSLQVESGDEEYELIYEGRFSTARKTMLPVAWQVDDTKGTENLVIVLSTEAVSKRYPQFNNHIESSDWMTHLVLTKKQ